MAREQENRPRGQLHALMRLGPVATSSKERQGVDRATGRRALMVIILCIYASYSNGIIYLVCTVSYRYLIAAIHVPSYQVSTTCNIRDPSARAPAFRGRAPVLRARAWAKALHARAQGLRAQAQVVRAQVSARASFSCEPSGTSSYEQQASLGFCVRAGIDLFFVGNRNKLDFSVGRKKTNGTEREYRNTIIKTFIDSHTNMQQAAAEQ